jgi:hypothetical protein
METLPLPEWRDEHLRRAHLDTQLGVLAGRQHGVVAAWQLWPLGWTRAAVRERLRSGHLVALHRGVYAVGHTALTQRGRWMAAVLAMGPGALASHRCAGALHGLLERGRPEVTVPGIGGRARRPFRVHRAALAPHDAVLVDGIPCTSPARTLCDLAGILDPERLERAVNAAEIAGTLDVAAIEEALDRLRPRGARALRWIIEDHRGAVVLRSPLEARFRRFLRAWGFADPVWNGHVALGDGTFLEVDCLWPAQRVALELDGRRFHDTGRAFERDRRRDMRLQALGWRPLRVTSRRLAGDPAGLADDLGAFLPRRVAS